MSVGFHYFETINQSLALQWLPKDRAPIVLGRILAAGSIAGIAVMGFVWLAFELLGLDFAPVYLIGGGVALAATLFFWFAYPLFEQIVPQRKQLILRKRYWLYYALTFLSGARRQIFVVFAGFMLVEKFGFSIGEVTLLYILNSVINIIAAPRIGRLINRIGERRTLIIEYIGLIIIFTGYAFAQTGWFAAFLYVADHLFFAMAIAIKTYFQKIADPGDFAPTAGVAFTINHIAAVFIPVLFGVIWLWQPAAVFLSGALIAVGSLGLAMLVPDDPSEGNETTMASRATLQPAE
jgi:predicted MFS family arabinose efflux permease